MFFFKRKSTLVGSDFFDGFVDHHSHIVPGVDDGIQQLDQSLEVLHYYEQLGVRHVVFTPHVMNDLHVEQSLVLERYAELSDIYSGAVTHSLAGEYMLDSGYAAHLEGGLRPLVGESALVETSYVSPPNNMNELLYETFSSSIQPIIAHPERYNYMSKSDYEQLACNGYGLQLNILSLSGFYGQHVVDKALYLLEHGMYSCVGTDLHSLSKFRKWVEAIRLTQSQLKCMCDIKCGLF